MAQQCLWCTYCPGGRPGRAVRLPAQVAVDMLEQVYCDGAAEAHRIYNENVGVPLRDSQRVMTPRLTTFVLGNHEDTRSSIEIYRFSWTIKENQWIFMIPHRIYAENVGVPLRGTGGTASGAASNGS